MIFISAAHFPATLRKISTQFYQKSTKNATRALNAPPIFFLSVRWCQIEVRCIPLLPGDWLHSFKHAWWWFPTDLDQHEGFDPFFQTRIWGRKFRIFRNFHFVSIVSVGKHHQTQSKACNQSPGGRGMQRTSIWHLLTLRKKMGGAFRALVAFFVDFW